MSILSPVLPTSGHYAIFGLDKENNIGLKPEFRDCAREAGDEYVEAAIERLRKKGATDFYFTTASFTWPDGTPHSRAAHFATRFRSYAVDIDCHGKDGEYPSPRAAGEAILPVLDKAGLFPSRVVFTGRGLQLFWAFEREVSTAQWQTFSRDMWSILMHMGVKADPACQGDRARIWRIPGTPNSANGQMARTTYDGEAYNFKRLKNRVNEYIDDNNVDIVEPVKETATREADEDGSVYECDQNNVRLRFLLERIPADFSTINLADYGLPHRDGYGLWRNIIWAAKRTGLSEAWDAVNDWAEQAEDAYDDLEEAVARTWDSDDEHKEVSIGPGTLVKMAQTFAPRGKRNGLKGFHFLDEDQAAALDGKPDIIAPENIRPDDDEDCTTWEDDDEIVVDPDEFWNCAVLEDDPDEYGDDIECELWPSWLFIESEEELTTFARENYPDVALGSGAYEANIDPEDGRETGYGGALDTMPPGEYGSPQYGAPEGYVFDRDKATNRITALCKIVKVEELTDTDGRTMTDKAPICREPIELLEILAQHDDDTGEKEVTYMVRKYDTVTEKPDKPFAIPGSLLSSEKELAKEMSAHGVLMYEKADSKMSLYLKNQIARMREARKEQEIMGRAGWRNKDHEFVLGCVRFDENGNKSNARIAPASLAALEGYGDVSGQPGDEVEEAKKQAAILESYGKEEMLPARAVIAMMLGAPLVRLTGRSAGAIYSYSTGTGTGKSTAHRVGLGFYGDPDKTVIAGSSSVASLGVVLPTLCDLPMYIDDLKFDSPEGGKNTRAGNALDNMRQWVLGLSQGKEKGRASQSGKSLSTGLGKWHTPVFMSSNTTPEVFLGSEGSSTEATYARVMVIPFSQQREEIDAAVGAKVNGDSVESAPLKHFGYIGQAFIRYVIRNQAAVRAELKAEYDRLELQAAERNQLVNARFHNTAIACGIVALRWMKAQGLCKTWNEQTTASGMAEYAYTTEENVRGLIANDPAVLMNDFRTEYGPNMVVCPVVNGLPTVLPDMDRHRRIAIRVEGDVAFISLDIFRAYCARKGHDYRLAIKELAKEFGSCSLTHNKVTFSKGIANAPRQTCRALRLPASAILDMKEETPENVVRLPSR